MKSISFIIVIVMSFALYAQEPVTVRDFLPELFYTKKNLIDHYQYNQLNYDSMLFNLENNSTQNIEIVSRDSNQIIYTHTYLNNKITDTLTLTFNSDKKLIESNGAPDDCNDAGSTDFYAPLMYDTYFTYNQSGRLVQIRSYCQDKSYSIQTDYYYTDGIELDSIIYSSGDLELYPFLKVILINSTFKKGDHKGSMALILNSQLDYVDWIKHNLRDTTYFNVFSNPQPSYYKRGNQSNEGNYVYEFDSLGRVTSYFLLIDRAEYRTIRLPYDCDLCKKNCEFTEKLKFYYVDNKISEVKINSFGESYDFVRNCSCVCLMRFNYNRKKIKEVTFYTRLDEDKFVFEKKWTPRKGFQSINENVDKNK